MTNPYQPPSEQPIAELTEMQRARLRDTLPVPDASFWGIAAASILCLMLAAVVIHNLLLLLMFPLLAGILRVCLVYSARARAGLPPLPANFLLVTSTFVCLVLQLSAIGVAVGCFRAIFRLSNMSSPNALVWLLVCVFGTIGMFLLMLRQSVHWAKS
ncbi:MAG: hypothetical protein IT423_21095 [Pirellulaceae bacterium]|nr:hypothetical protein [Pirellulaceae bacterium]